MSKEEIIKDIIEDMEEEVKFESEANGNSVSIESVKIWIENLNKLL